MIKALACKCHALILSSNMNKIKEDVEEEKVEVTGTATGTGADVNAADSFLSTYKELSKWENIEKSDTNWELAVHKNNLSKR